MARATILQLDTHLGNSRVMTAGCMPAT